MLLTFLSLSYSSYEMGKPLFPSFKKGEKEAEMRFGCYSTKVF